ncbi:nicotinate-nucleotide adenylyltransferase [Alienimonas californiensis]|uniref:Probable nicotinate-nucleotide adenylyltransferase n=1 Tax=Alienimonas californiensis TaxID=2527989 RepID=A0A517PDI8_9PLAN|nr:nicotinate-nucleotide adenylyltransferase [Alienimonas californiensis]QDT17401.1 Nicotinate-nucleotide adenylyltransferase [Alienimonas californiensis]
MRIGLFGGTFDPIHLGHLLLAEVCREELELDEVRFLPAASNPLKENGPIADGPQRCEMVQFAISGNPAFAVDRREVKRGGPSFAVDTLAEVAAENPDAELFFLMGADALADLPAWREPGRVLDLATIVAVNRGDVPAVVPPGIESNRVRFVAMPACDLSATDLRRRAAEGLSLRYRTPAAVIAYLHDKYLYRI